MPTYLRVAVEIKYWAVRPADDVEDKGRQEGGDRNVTIDGALHSIGLVVAVPAGYSPVSGEPFFGSVTNLEILKAGDESQTSGRVHHHGC